MLEITIDNCHKRDLETLIDPNNSQDFWINRRDLEIEIKRNWQVIFDKCKDSLRQKYRKELRSNITFQPNKIFVKYNLFEKIIKSCKTTNLQLLKLKEKLGLCLYEVICDKQDLISMSEEIFKEENIFTQHNVENKQLRKQNEELRKENDQLRKNNVVKDVTIKETIEIKSPEEEKNSTDNYPNCFDRNKFEKIIVDSSKFNYKNKMGEFKDTGIKDLVKNIRNNTISEISAKKGLNKLKEIKKAEIIKYKTCTPKQKELLNLFNDLLDIILSDETLKSKCQKDKTLISSKDENEDENENEKQNKLLNNDNNPNAKNKKTSTNTKESANKKNDENRNILLEYMEDVDDKLFKNTVTIKILTVL